MKINRQEELSRLVENLELTLKEKGHKFIAYTSDTEKSDLEGLINELAPLGDKNKKTIVLSYNAFIKKIPNVEYDVLDIKNDNYEEIINKYKDYDYVLVLCPNVLVSNYYLHMSHFVRDIAIVTRKWSSKLKNIVKIKDMLSKQNLDILGIIYQE